MIAFDIGTHLAGTIIFVSVVAYWAFEEWLKHKKNG